MSIQSITKFDEKSHEVVNAKMNIRVYGYDIPTMSPPPVPLEVYIKNVEITEGIKYTMPFSEGHYFDQRLNEKRFHKVISWRKTMYEIETDFGVFISACGAPSSQYNVTVNSLPSSEYVSGEPVDWLNYVGKRIKVFTGPTENIPVWSWIYFIHENIV